jgi:hypothetical protein
MREQILRQFFEGTCSASELARDVAGSGRKASQKLKITSIEDMDANFDVTADMAVRVCDAVLSGDLPASALQTIGFALMASDKFQWNGDEDDVLASVIADWSCPEINYPLTVENVQRFRSWLTRAEEYPPKPTTSRKEDRGNIVSAVEKKTIRPH